MSIGGNSDRSLAKIDDLNRSKHFLVGWKCHIPECRPSKHYARNRFVCTWKSNQTFVTNKRVSGVSGRAFFSCGMPAHSHIHAFIGTVNDTGGMLHRHFRVGFCELKFSLHLTGLPHALPFHLCGVCVCVPCHLSFTFYLSMLICDIFRVQRDYYRAVLIRAHTHTHTM